MPVVRTGSDCLLFHAHARTTTYLSVELISDLDCLRLRNETLTSNVTTLAGATICVFCYRYPLCARLLLTNHYRYTSYVCGNRAVDRLPKIFNKFDCCCCWLICEITDRDRGGWRRDRHIMRGQDWDNDGPEEVECEQKTEGDDDGYGVWTCRCWTTGIRWVEMGRCATTGARGIMHVQV